MSTIKTWQERADDASRNNEHVEWPQIYMKAEIAELRAALAASGGNAAPEFTDEHSAAWQAVAAALDKGVPGWLNGPLSGMDSAVKAIEELCSKRQAITPLQIVQLANAHLTTSDYIWSGDVEQICIFAQACAQSGPNAALVAALEALEEVGALEDGLLGDDPKVIKAQKMARKALSAAGQEVGHG